MKNRKEDYFASLDNESVLMDGGISYAKIIKFYHLDH